MTLPVITPVTDPFTDFWAAYPRKSRMGTARGRWVWALAKVSGDASVIIEGAKRYAKHVANTNLEYQYVMHPHTWLDSECWADEYQLPKSAPVDARALLVEKQREAAARGSRFAADWLKREGLDEAGPG